MTTPHSDFNRCRAYVAAHLKSDTPKSIRKHKRRPTITISRQTGTRTRSIAHKLSEAMNATQPASEIPWTIFDENLVRKILEDHNLPRELEKFMPDDHVSEIESSINEILGRHPSQWTLFEHTVETIVNLSRIGHSIIIGRAGNKITHGLSNVLNVRFIGSLENRIERITKLKNVDKTEAIKFIKKEDAARKHYLQQHFSADIEDALSYDLVINTDALSDESIVQILIAAIQAKSK